MMKRGISSTLPKSSTPKTLPNATSTSKGVSVHYPQHKNSSSSNENTTRHNNSGNNLSGVEPIADDSGLFNVSQREFDKFKDTVKLQIQTTTSDLMKRIVSLEKKLAEVTDECSELREQLSRQPRKKSERKKTVVSPIVSQHVRLAYKSLGIDNGWSFTETFQMQKNAEVTRHVIRLTKDMELGFSDETIFAAAKTHFETLNRAAHEKADASTKRRRTTRRHRLFNMRTKIIDEYGEAPDKELWALSCAAMMTDQETDDEGPVKKYKLCRPSWRSNNFNDLIDRVNVAMGGKKMYSDIPSSRIVDYTNYHPDTVAGNNTTATEPATLSNEEENESSNNEDDVSESSDLNAP